MTDVLNFVQLVEIMRQTQREFFVTRSSNSLKKAKELERKVDRNLPIIKRMLSEKMPTQMVIEFD